MFRFEPGLIGPAFNPSVGLKLGNLDHLEHGVDAQISSSMPLFEANSGFCLIETYVREIGKDCVGNKNVQFRNTIMQYYSNRMCFKIIRTISAFDTNQKAGIFFDGLITWIV